MNEIKIIQKTELCGHTFSVFGTPDEPLFLAKEVAEAIEHSDVSMMMRNIDDEEKGTSIVCTPGGKQKVLMLTEDGLYEVLMQSRKPIAKEFKKGVKLILKEIRTKGGYMVALNETPDETMARALIIAHATRERMEKRIAEQQERIALQDAELKKQAPKVQYVNEVLQSNQTYTTTQIAKELDMTSAQALQKILCDYNIMYRQSGQWLLTAKHNGKGYTKTRTHTYISSSGEQGTNTITVWTEAGRAFLHNIIKRIEELQTKKKA